MITVHHLNYSRSTRVLWLLEELGLEYELVSYQRNAQFRAPPELARIHPLGKAPVIVDGELVLAESGVILDYINTRYGGGRFAPPADPQRVLHEEWLQYAESSAAFPILLNLIGAMTGGLPDRLAGFAKPGLAQALDYIGAGVATGPYLMGEMFTLADIQMSYLLLIARQAGMLEGHPAILDYVKRLELRPAYAKALAVGGPMTAPTRA